VGGAHLALLGQLQPAVDRARGLTEARAVRRTAAATDRAASAMEEVQLDAAGEPSRSARPGPGGASRRRPGGPIPCSSPSSEHHLLPITGPADAPDSPDRSGASRIWPASQRVGRLEERHDVRAATASGTPGLPRASSGTSIASAGDAGS
jgi:hypothetical protein